MTSTDGIKVVVRKGDKEPAWELTFRDLMGERLSEELDQLNALKRDRAIPSQVDQCDAFLFYFDPASAEFRHELERHHQRELQRAESFINYILKRRENDYLPIIFVQTHADIWEYDSAARAKADEWFARVHNHLVERYQQGLRKYHPKSIVEMSRTCVAVSSAGQSEAANARLEVVIENLEKLVRDARNFRQKTRTSGFGALLGGVIPILLLGIILAGIYFASNGDPHYSGSNSAPPVVAEMTEREIDDRLDDFERVLKIHPRATVVPPEQDAKKLNDHLQWALELVRQEDQRSDLSRETLQRVRQAIDGAAEIIAEKYHLPIVSVTDKTQCLTNYLEDLDNLTGISPTLAEVQDKYWPLCRTRVIQQLSEILKRRRDIASTPTDTITELLATLRQLESEISRARVYGPQARQLLIDELKTLATFCEDRKATRSYPVTFRVISALIRPDTNVSLAFHILTLQFPGHEVGKHDYLLTPRKSDDGEILFSTKQKNYPLALGLGMPITGVLAVHERAVEWRTLQQFDFTQEPGPLAVLGLPLMRPNQPEIVKHLTWETMEIKVGFSGFPPVPGMLWDAAIQATNHKENPR